MERRTERAARAVFATVVVLTLTAALLLNLKVWFEKRFEARVVEALEPVATQRTPQTSRVVLFILDDLGYDTATRNLPKVIERARGMGSFSQVLLDRFTYTIAGVYTLGTGDQPSLVLIKDDFGTKKARANHFFENARRAGARTVHIGESLWSDMFGDGIDEVFTRKDVGPFAGYGSDEMLAAVGRALDDRRNTLIVVHLGETGHLSHRHGVYGKPLEALLHRLDGVIADLATKHADGTTWLVASDHGTTLEGQHGGLSLAEQTTFLAAWGPGIAHREGIVVPQVDLANVVTFLLGAPFPSQSCGLLPDLFSAETAPAQALARDELVAQKRRLYDGLQARFPDDGLRAAIPDDAVALKQGIERIKFDTTAPIVMQRQLLFALLLVGLLATQLRRRPTLRHVVAGVASLALVALLPPDDAWMGLFVALPALALDAFGLWRERKTSAGLVVALSALTVSVLFFQFPTYVYLTYTQTGRYTFLVGAIVLSLAVFLTAAFLRRPPDSGRPSWPALIGWGIALAYFIAADARYYQFLLPFGLIVLVGLDMVHATDDRRARLRRFLAAFGLLLVPLTLAIGQNPDLDLMTFRALRDWMFSSGWDHELALALGVTGLAGWMNRHYAGRLGRSTRALGWAALILVHVAYHERLVEANPPLIALLVAALAWQVRCLWLDRSDGAPYWGVMIWMTLMTQQHTGAELVVAIAGALLFRWLELRNPYPAGTLRQPAYTAFALIAFAVLLMTVKGNLFRFSSIKVLKGFVGFNMEVDVPVNAVLAALYYAQPVLLALLVVRATTAARRLVHLYEAGLIGGGLLLLQAVFTSTLFSSAVLPGDTYNKSAAGTVLLLVTGLALLVAAIAAFWARPDGEDTRTVSRRRVAALTPADPRPAP